MPMLDDQETRPPTEHQRLLARRDDAVLPSGVGATTTGITDSSVRTGFAIAIAAWMWAFVGLAQPQPSDATRETVVFDEQFRDWRARCITSRAVADCYARPDRPTPGVAVLLVPRNAAFDLVVISPDTADRLTGASIQIDRGHSLEARQCEASLCAFSAEGVPDLEQALRLGRMALLRVTRADRPALEFELSLSGVSAALDRVASARQARRP